MFTSRGKCKNEKHKMVIKKDKDNRPFSTCDICGNTPINNLIKKDK